MIRPWRPTAPVTPRETVNALRRALGEAQAIGALRPFVMVSRDDMASLAEPDPGL